MTESTQQTIAKVPEILARARKLTAVPYVLPQSGSRSLAESLSNEN